MAIEFSCDHCRRTLKLKDKCAGLTGECPFCKGVITVPTFKSEKPTAGPDEVGDRKEPTEKQVEYAHSLGIDVPSGISRSGLSQLIDDTKDNLPATERQKEFLRELGISFSDDIRRNQISMLIDAAMDLQGQMAARAPQRLEEQMKAAGMLVGSATEEQLLEALSDQNKMFFAFVMDDDEFRYQDNLPMKGRLVWNCALNVEDVKYLVASIAYKWARDLDMNAYCDEFDGVPPTVEFTAGELATDAGNVVQLSINLISEE